MSINEISRSALERFDHPRNMGSLAGANGHACVTGPCGDTVAIWLRVEENWVKQATFTTTGCGASRACGSMATELAAGRSLQTALEMEQSDILDELMPFPEDHWHCALLAANVMNAAARDYLTKQTIDSRKGSQHMRIAVPVADGKLAMHFGHCEKFALIDADPASKQILKQELVDAPEHQPGLLPRWLGERGANVIIAGGMGSRAQLLFAEQQIQVLVGAPADTPENLVQAFLGGSLQSGENVCDH